MADRNPVPVPPGYRAPDLYAIVLRSWIDALELRLLDYRRKDFARG